MYSGFFGTVIAHIISLLATLWAIIKIELSTVKPEELLAIRFSFAFITLNSSLAILRYGNSDIGYKLRKLHIITLNLSTIFSVTIIEALLHYFYSSSNYLLYLPALNFLPFLYNVTAKDYRTRLIKTDLFIGINSVLFLYVCVLNHNYNGVAFILSYLFGYFVVGECGFLFDTEVPCIDAYQYLQCFFNYFVVSTFAF